MHRMMFYSYMAATIFTAAELTKLSVDGPASANARISYILTSADDTSLVKKGAQLQKISGQFSFTEGPAADKKGNIYFTDQPNDQIWKYDVYGKLSLYMEKAGRSNGLYFDRKGNLISCADNNNEIWKISPAKKTTVLVGKIQGKRLNGPNDLWVNKSGGIYFTDPYYKRPWWNHTEPEIAGQHVYYYDPVSKDVRAVDTNMQKPNGIVGTPDGRFLYVADIGASKTYRYKISPDGTLSEKTLFTEQGSDGMTIDVRGNLYLTGKGISVFNPEGKKIAQIDVPESWTANVCFGGKKHDMLFITASKTVYTLMMQVKGAR